jgi:hypothetical protein
MAIGLQCLGNSVLRWPALSNCRSNTDGSGSLCRFREDGNSSFTSALVSIGKHLGMFVDQVQVRARYAISDQPMSAEEWKKQYVKEG